MVNYVLEGFALAVTFMVNLPFGYWRKVTKKLSKEWFLAVHSPVPLVFLTRFLAGVSLSHIPLFVLSFFLGQFTGGKIRSALEQKYGELSRCLFADLGKILKKAI